MDIGEPQRPTDPPQHANTNLCVSFDPMKCPCHLGVFAGLKLVLLFKLNINKKRGKKTAWCHSQLLLFFFYSENTVCVLRMSVLNCTNRDAL